MATVTGLTKERMEAIEAACIIAGAVDLSGHLILTQFDDTEIDAGSVIGPQGDVGPEGPTGPEGPSAAATSAATPDTLALRDGSGRLRVVDPSNAADAATKAYVDSLVSGIEIGNAIDLNTITAPGVYTQTTDAEAGAGSNYPAPARAGLLEVSSNNNNMVWQTYTPYGDYGAIMFKRAKYGSTWSAWTMFRPNLECAFRAAASATQSFTVTTWHKMVFGSEQYDYGSNFAANKFTAPVKGIYHFTAHWCIAGSATGIRYMHFMTNGGLATGRVSAVPSTTSAVDLNIGVDYLLQAGDVVEVECYQSGGATLSSTVNAEATNTFSGELIREVA